ncbi:MAG: DUF1508 domain-containing protein [Polyangiales bacterium]
MLRRTFTAVVATGLVGLFLAHSAVAGDAKLKFELYKDKAGQFRWRLNAANGETLATSGEGYKAKASARKGIEKIRTAADELTFELYEDKKGEHRFRIEAKNGKVIGASSEGYKQKASAEKAIQTIKDGAKGSTVSDETT